MLAFFPVPIIALAYELQIYNASQKWSLPLYFALMELPWGKNTRLCDHFSYGVIHVVIERAGSHVISLSGGGR